MVIREFIIVVAVEDWDIKIMVLLIPQLFSYLDNLGLSFRWRFVFMDARGNLNNFKFNQGYF